MSFTNKNLVIRAFITDLNKLNILVAKNEPYETKLWLNYHLKNSYSHLYKNLIDEKELDDILSQYEAINRIGYPLNYRYPYDKQSWNDLLHNCFDEIINEYKNNNNFSMGRELDNLVNSLLLED